MSTFAPSAKNPPAKGERIVVTGLGAVTPIGNDAVTFWQNLAAGCSGARLYQGSGLGENPMHLACEVIGFDPSMYLSPKEIRITSRSSQMAVAASKQAVQDAGLEIGRDVSPERLAVVINTSAGGVGEMEDGIMLMMERGLKGVSPFAITRGMPNACSSSVALFLGARGPVMTATMACASGNYALLEAAHILRRGEAEVVLAGGVESMFVSSYIAGLVRMGALTKWAGDPAQASRPFDLNRDGFVFGEGAGVVVVESEEHARRRGATILAEILGGSLTNDGYHFAIPEPRGDGAVRAMRGALSNSGLAPEDVDVIFAHGTATQLNDATETLAIKTVFGQQAYDIPVTATKSMIGHAMGAAGALSAIAAIYCLRDGMVPPTINYQTPDPACDLDYVPNKARQLAANYAMVNAFGLGGVNVALLLGKAF